MLIETLVGTAAIISAVIVKKLTTKQRHVEVPKAVWDELDSPYFAAIDGDYATTMNERYRLYRQEQALS